MTTRQDNRRYDASNRQSQSPNSEQTINPEVDQTVNQQPEVSINPQVEQNTGAQVEQNMSPKFEHNVNVSFESKSESSATGRSSPPAEHSPSQRERSRSQAEHSRSQPPRRQASHQSERASPTMNDEVDLLRISRIVWVLVGGLESLISLRIFLKLIAVNPDSGFARFIYGITEVFLLPFSALTATPAANGSVLEISSFIAIIAYAIMGGIVVRLMRAAH